MKIIIYYYRIKYFYERTQCIYTGYKNPENLINENINILYNYEFFTIYAKI